MGSFFTLARSNSTVQAVLSIVLGVLLAFWPGITTVTIVYLIAAYLAFTGISSLVAYYRSRGTRAESPAALLGGIVLLVIALIIAVFPHVFAGFFSLILGIVLLVGGLINVIRAMELRRYQSSSWLAALIVGIVIALGGLVIVINPFGTTVMFMLLLGILLIVKGIAELLVNSWVSGATRNLP